MKRKVGHIFAALCIIVLSAVLFVVLSDSEDYDNKIWLHRCDAIEKYNEKAGKYKGIEVDVCYREAGFFDVTHDEINGG